MQPSITSGFPKISIVTPSFNQAAYLEDTILSVLSQNYPNLEYVIMDGGSTDGSVDIIRRYADQLTYWESKPDQGQYDAINRGFQHTTGEIMAYLNSDDKYTPWSFSTVSDIFHTLTEVAWLTTLTPLTWNKHGQPIRCERLRGFNRKSFMRGENLPLGYWYVSGMIQQESTFWRRSLWERAGAGFDPGIRLAGDFDLWARFYQHTDLYGLPVPVGGFRWHGEQKTSRDMSGYLDEALTSLSRVGGKPRGRIASLWRKRLLKTLSLELARRFRIIPPSKQIRFDPVTQQWAIEII